MPGCPWYARWWHRRRRQIDHGVIWPVIRAKAAQRFPEDEEAAVLLTLKQWVQFIQQPSQGHWRCPCSDLDDRKGLV